MTMTARQAGLGLALSAAVAGCAAPGSSLVINSEAAGSSYFSLGRPAAYKVGSGLELAGRACRRARTTVLTPSRVRLEHVTVDGQVIGVAHAFLPQASRRTDLPCSNYRANVAWTLAEGDTIRACFDRGHACPGAPPAQIAVPAS